LIDSIKNHTDLVSVQHVLPHPFDGFKTRPIALTLAPMTQTSNNDGRVADAVREHWADRLLPRNVRPYARLARLERPIGWWLLLLPGWWAIGMAQTASGGGIANLWYLTLFLIGAVVMRGAGCTFNDIVDRDFDAAVARTRSRPIPSGHVSVGQAKLFMIALSLTGFVVLLQFNWFAVSLGVLSLATVAIYPFMKRFTYWPQVFLGIAFNWSALLGWAAVRGELELPAILMYLGGISWTLAYDTIYAHQDKEDDLAIGIKSTALKFGAATPKWLTVFFALTFILLFASGFYAGAGIIFYTGLAAAALHAAWQLARLDVDDPDRCLMLFRSNRNFGLIVFAGIMLDNLLATWVHMNP
jgi:4-hydroxybenzoate polyprenyltransferase